MAAFIEDKADYFKQFLTAEEYKRKAWKGLLADIRHSVGNAKHWGVIWKFPPCPTCFNALFNTLPLARS